jgi:hypothetical protein
MSVEAAMSVLIASREAITRCWIKWLRLHFVHKYAIALNSGGPEEGGWWFDSGVPVWRIPIPILGDELAYKLSRWLNGREHERAKREEKYGYTSVLSYRSNHFSYRVEDFARPRPFPTTRPHYE